MRESPRVVRGAPLFTVKSCTDEGTASIHVCAQSHKEVVAVRRAILGAIYSTIPMLTRFRALCGLARPPVAGA